MCSNPPIIPASLVHRNLYALVVLAILPILPMSLSTQAASAKEAARYFQEGRYDDALEIYRHLALENPDDTRYTYNAGVAAFKAGQYAEAMEQFDAASLSPDLGIQQQAHYNMGNTMYRAGEATEDFEQKTQAWKQAVQRYQHALTINEADTLAQDNLDFVKKRIEELQQQQQEQQQQDQNEQNEDQNEEDSESNSQDNEEQQNQENQQQQQQDQQDDSQQANDPQEQQNQEQNEQQENESQQGDEESQPEQSPEANPSEQDPQQGDQNSAQPQEGKMTPEQAKQLLDAERDQAKAMIFRPPEKRKTRDRSFKDW